MKTLSRSKSWPSPSTAARTFLCLLALQPVSHAVSPVTQPQGNGLVVTVPEEGVQVPMEHRSGHVMVDVWIHGEGPFPFVLDTCAGGHGTIDEVRARELGLEEVGSMRVGDGTGQNRVRRKLVRVEALQIGDATFEGLTLMVTPEEDGAVDRGIVGIGLFEKLLLTVDYAHSEVRMEHGFLDSDSEHVVPMRMPSGVPEVELRIGEARMRAHVDSGNMGGLMLPGSYKTRLKLAGELELAGKARTVANQFETWAAPLAEPVVFAGHRLDGLRTNFADILTTANLGYHVLKGFELKIDTRRSLVAFLPNGTVPRSASVDAQRSTED